MSNPSIVSKYASQEANETREYNDFLREYAAGLNQIANEARAYLEAMKSAYPQKQNGGTDNAQS